jgi:Peptidoglycan-synthase activator LpoB
MRLILLSFMLLSVLMSVGCSRGSADKDANVTPPPPPSSWFADDSVAVANELVPMLLKRSWVADFKQRTGQQPKVALGPITDRSQGAIDLEVYRGELRRVLTEGGMVQVVDARDAADFLLKGSVGANDGVERDVPVRRYQIDLVIVERGSGDVATPSISIEKQKDDRAIVAPTAKPAGSP